LILVKMNIMGRR